MSPNNSFYDQYNCPTCQKPLNIDIMGRGDTTITYECRDCYLYIYFTKDNYSINIKTKDISIRDAEESNVFTIKYDESYFTFNVDESMLGFKINFFLDFNNLDAIMNRIYKLKVYK